ncbi:hypothetical protein PC122_g22589, partial [Phytophthora cactorum]
KENTVAAENLPESADIGTTPAVPPAMLQAVENEESLNNLPGRPALQTQQKESSLSNNEEQFRTLRNEQLVRWKKDGKSVTDVSMLLNFGNNRGLGQKFRILDDYVTLVKKSDETLLRTSIKGVGGEEKLGSVLYAARKQPDSMEKAQRLENSLIGMWRREGQLPANVFQWLKLYENVDDAFSADNLNRFMNYVEKYNVNEPTNEKPVIELYTNAFGDAVVANKLVSAMNDPATSTAVKKLQAQQVKGWIKRRIYAGDVFTILRRYLALVLEQASETAESTLLQKKQFAAFISKDISPEDFMSRVFKTVPNSASEEQKAIAAKFNAFYQTRGQSNRVVLLQHVLPKIHDPLIVISRISFLLLNITPLCRRRHSVRDSRIIFAATNAVGGNI